MYMGEVYKIEVNDPVYVEDHTDNYSLGWVKLFRSIEKKAWYNNSKYVHLWVHILINANHKGKEVWFNGEAIKIESGQFLTGRKRLSVDTGISQSTIERILKTFENGQQIEQQKTNRNRLITVVNWGLYQNSGQQNGQQMDNRWTTDGQQTDTNKNVKNIKKYIYSEADFLNDWKKVRETVTGHPTNITKLTLNEKQNFNKLQANYDKKQFQDAMIGLFKQDNILPSCLLRPTHFLDDGNLEKYLNTDKGKVQLFKKGGTL